MCGLLGFVPANKIDQTTFSVALDQMRHRGPDHQEVKVIDHLMLGHARLSIVDLEQRSHQPMCAAGGNIWIVFNGEIYNFRELRRLLATEYKFVTLSDTEVILAAYCKWGVSAIARLNGMFSIAIFDRTRNELVLARDQVGKKPLYYACDGGSIAFGSELRSVVAVMAKQLRVDEGALNSYLARGFTGTNQSIFSEVKKMPPGSLLRVNLDNLQNVGPPFRYWTLPISPEASRTMSEPALLEELDAMLHAATEARLVADVPIGCFLSGGLDSSLVAAIASKHVSGRLRTYTITFTGSSVDESTYARKVATFLGTDHHEFNVGVNLIEEIPGLVARLDEPFADSSFVPTYFVCKEARREATVCLSGDGGDELLAGYEHYDNFAHEEQLRNYLPNSLRRCVGATAQLLPERHKTRSLKRLAIASPIDGIAAYYTNFFNASERRQILSSAHFSASNKPEQEVRSFYREDLSWIENTCQADFRSYMVDDILVKVDRMSMLNSLEVRSPLLDQQIAEFCFTKVPAVFKRNRTVKKYLLKQLATRYLPEDFSYERKRGFSVPLGDWFKGRLGDILLDVMDSRASGVINSRYVKQLLLSHRRGFSNYSKRLFCVLVWELWYRAQSESYRR